MRFPTFSKDTKQTVLGGLVGSLTVQAESGLSWFVPAYPQPLKDKLNPALPRNGALIANIAPAGIAYVVTRKHASARAENLRTGIFIYDIPKLIDQLVYSVAYSMGGTPVASARLTNSKMALNATLMPRNVPVVTYAQAPTGLGKYSMKVASTPSVVSMGGIGKYR